MKVTFFTLKQNVEIFKNRLEQPLKAGDYAPPVIRDHRKNAELAVFEMENRYQALQPTFERQLKTWEYRKEIINLKIEQ